MILKRTFGYTRELLRKLLLLGLLMIAATAVAETPAFVVVDGDTLRITDELVVLGSRAPVAGFGPVRGVSLLDKSAMDHLPVRSTAEALAMLPQVEVSQRQQYGTQADLSIRGSTFEQVQVLLDGFPVGDPQTGHHNLNLPLDLSDIERLEVLGGQGAALYGAGAFGGTVNVVPRAPSQDRGAELELSGGDFATRSGRLSLESGALDLRGIGVRNRAGLRYFKTDGDHDGTDAENLSALGLSRIKLGRTDADLQVGYARREFGALDFYAPYPSFERTQTFFTGLRARRDLAGRWTVEPRLHLRRHVDHFVLLRDTPDVYTNDHVSRLIGAETRLAYFMSPALTLASVVAGDYQDIASTGMRGGVTGPALGDHLRRRASAGVELAGAHDEFNWSAGLRLDHQTDLDPEPSYSGALAWRARPDLTLRSSLGTFYRAPTFTELYYVDPGNQGDAALQPERGWAWDLGAKLDRSFWHLGTTVFQRHEEDLIDWLRPAGSTLQWQAMNIGTARVSGVTQTVCLRDEAGRALRLHYTYIDKTLDPPAGQVGKYASLTSRHLAALSLQLPLGAGWRLSPVLRYRERPMADGDLLADLSLRGDWRSWWLRLDLTNLADRVYEEVPGVPMPGRMLSLGVGRRIRGMISPRAWSVP